MKSKNKHINKFLHDPLPDPEVPADDAWASMNDMLNAPSGGQGANGSGKLSQFWKSVVKFKGFLIATSSVVVTSAVVALLVLTKQTNSPEVAANQSGSVEHGDSASTRSQDLSLNTTPSASIPSSINTATKAAEPKASNGFPAVSEIPATHSGKVATGANPVGNGNARQSESYGRKTENSLSKDNAKKPSTGSDLARSTGAHTTNSHTTDTRAVRAHANASRTSVTPTRDAHTPNERTNGRTGIPTGPGLIPQKELASVSPEKNNTAEKTGTEVSAKSAISLLQPHAGHFKSAESNLTSFIKKPVQYAAQPSPKRRNPVLSNVHLGPEWIINRSIVSTEYMLTGADSIKHPWRLAIPGLFVSKTWNRHSATFIFNPLHSYFGDKALVAQTVDTIRVTDSLFHRVEHNTNLIKAFGVNFSLQYQYRFISLMSVVGGISYARYSAALLRGETVYSTGAIIDESHFRAKGRETLKSYIRPQQWNIRAGIQFHSPDVFNNRLQFALITIIPVSNLSLRGFKDVKSPNVQGSLRFLVK